jgi:hypothetical protein
MKITKRQLRKIIKEEKAKVLAEQNLRKAVRRKLIESEFGPENRGFGGKRRDINDPPSRPGAPEGKRPPLGKGFVAERIFGIYDLAYDDDGQIVDTTGRELREDEWLQEDWEEGRNIEAVAASLKKLGVTHIGGDAGMMTIEELGLDVPSEDFAPIDDVVKVLRGQ